MQDGTGTTILIYLSQFFSEYLYELANDFDEVYPVNYPATVWFAFQDKLDRVPRTAGHGQKRKKRLENDISAAWSEVNALLTLCPNHLLNLSAEKADKTDSSNYKVYGSFIHNEHCDAIVSGKHNWPFIRFLIEFKHGGTACDPFDDTFGHDPDAVAESRIAVRSQLMSYVERLFAYQHRTAVYMLLVNGETFRVLRWDRSGVIVTEAINYIRTISGTRMLLLVTYAFSKLTLEQQGFDLNVRMLNPNSCGYQRMDMLAKPQPGDIDYQEKQFENPNDLHKVFTEPGFAASFGALIENGQVLLHLHPSEACKTSHRSAPPAIPVFSYIRRLWRESLVSGFPRYVINIDDRHYLVGKHIFIGFGMVGRGTRGYVALEWETQRFVFLKDSWRLYYVGLEQEGAILSTLNEHGVPSVPTVVRYGDVHYTTGDCLEQETETSHYSTATGGKRPDYTRYQMFSPGLNEEVILDAWLQADEGGSEDRLPPIIYQNQYATWQLGDQPMATDTDFNPLAEPASMPTLKAGPTKHVAKLAIKPSASHGSEQENRPTGKASSQPERIQGYGLRHMVHSRLIVNEVCLPMTEFTSSYQLANIIFDCMRAHWRAWTLCKYMHRDVSAGNILIRPVVLFEDGKWSIRWQGILADWELAQHSDKQTALQMHRPGTWHFRSVHLINNPGSASTIADELESFLHVLVYGAVRRVHSNLVLISAMMKSYFVGGEFDEIRNQVSCPTAKWYSVVYRAKLQASLQSELVFSDLSGTIVKDHPFNELIAVLLRIFHARYVVLAYEERGLSSVFRNPPSTRRRCFEIPMLMENHAGNGKTEASDIKWG